MTNLEKKDHYENAILAKVAWLYYIEDLTQKEISEKLGITRIKVIKLLETAREKKIVQFHFSTLDRQKIHLENALINQYHLKDAFVAPFSSDDKVNDSIAQAAAMYIDDLISDNAYISMGYGDTVSKVLNNLATISNKNISIISMTGGVAPYLPNNESNIFRARLHLLPSPLFMSSKETAQKIKEEEAVKEIIEMSKLSEISVVGIGGMDKDATVLSSHILNNNDFVKLKMQGAAGDILMHFFDAEGNLIDSEIEEKLVSTDLKDLKKQENVIAVAAGSGKYAAIKAALKGGYINTLITDEATAEYLCQEET